MTTEPEQSTDTPVDEAVVKREKATVKAKAVRKRKKPTTPRKRRKPAAKPVEPVPVPLNREEIIETLGKAKDEFIVAVGEPIMGIVGKYSQMARDGLSGLVSGFLGNKKRDD